MEAAGGRRAFLQADDIREQGIRIFGRPTADMSAKLAGLMGLQRGQLLRMCKPAFGDVRAPLQWYKSAYRGMTDAWFVKHFLDPCLYMSFRPLESNEKDDFGYMMDGQNVTLDGILGLHVDDFVGGGEGVTCEQDVTPEGKSAQVDSFKSRVRTLNNRFRFGKWDFGMDQVFCGIEVSQSADYRRIKLSNEAYVHKVLPISMEKARRATPTEFCTAKEHSQLRGLNGSLQWPSAQTMVFAAASVSFSQSASSPTVSDLLEANKTLRFVKNNADVGLTYQRLGELSAMRLGVYTDASWASRPGGESQGGYLLFAIGETKAGNGSPTPLIILDWCSRKLTRVSRSSLASEAQAAANAVDALGWAKVMMALIVRPDLKPDSGDAQRLFGRSPLITDCKALYDAARSMSAGRGLQEKRTAIEVLMINEKMREINADWAWTDTHQQMADGLTKVGVRQQFADKPKRGVHALKYDPSSTAGKKIAQADRDSHERELDDAAAQNDADAYETRDTDATPNNLDNRLMRRVPTYAAIIARVTALHHAGLLHKPASA